MNFAATLLDLDYRLKPFSVSGRRAGIRIFETEGAFGKRKSSKYFRFFWQILFPAVVRTSTTVLELFRLPRQITRPYRPVA
jgi:hypothetical protein